MQRMIDLQYAQQQLLQQQQQLLQQPSLSSSNSLFPPPPPSDDDDPPPPPNTVLTTHRNDTDANNTITTTTTNNSNTTTGSSSHSAAAEAVAVSPKSTSTLLVREVTTATTTTTPNQHASSSSSSTNNATTIFHHQNLFLDAQDSYASLQGSFDSLYNEPPPPFQQQQQQPTPLDASVVPDESHLIDEKNDPGALLWRTSSERLLASFRHQDSQTYSPETPKSYDATTSGPGSRQNSRPQMTTNAVVDGTVETEVDHIAGTTNARTPEKDWPPPPHASNDHNNNSRLPYRSDPTDHDVDHLISSTTQLLPTLNRSNVSGGRQSNNSNSQYPFHSVSYGSLLPASSTSEPVVVSHANVLDALFVPPPPPPPYDPQQQQQQKQMDHQQQLMQDAMLRGFSVPSSSSLKRRTSFSCVQQLCACFYQFFYMCCLFPIQQSCLYLYSAESLHRSFCYGAIDGMLTGAGIVSTFCGMGLLSTTTNNSPPVRALVVVFTATTCCADAVCMAIGHVWTTHIMYDTRSHERQSVRQQLFHNKSDAKGMLVDLLLSRGMLKIDAMSIADTLEGYPDLFINVLTGDALSAGGSLPHPNYHDSDEHENLMYHENDTDGAISPGPLPPHQQQQPSQRRTSYPSYGRLTEYEMDPDTYTAQTMTNESRKESCCMMMGFVLFAVVPSIIYTLVPTIMFGPQHDAAGIRFSSFLFHHPDGTASVTSTASSAHDDASPALADKISTTTTEAATVAMMLNPNTIIIVCTASIMWCLGVWKSRFVMSHNKRNWFIFGIETVMVLIICIVCAYGVGTVLNHTFLPDEYVLQVVQQQQQPQRQHSTATKHHDIETTSTQRQPHPTNIAAAVVDVTSTTTSTLDSSSTNDNTMDHSIPSKTTTTTAPNDKNDDNVSHPHYWYSF